MANFLQSCQNKSIGKGKSFLINGAEIIGYPYRNEITLNIA